MNDVELSERELAIAKKAASLAVQQMQDEFYKSVGRTIINRLLVTVGLLAVAFAAGKGWIPWGK